MKNYFPHPRTNAAIVPSSLRDLPNPKGYGPHPNSRDHKNNSKFCHRPLSPGSTKLNYIPIASGVALLISWLGLIFFCTKMHQGVGSIIGIAQQIFANVVPYLKNAQIAFIFLGVLMALSTLAMAVICACATVNCCHFDCTGCQPPSKWSRRLGSRWVCGTFVALAHILNLCWLGILSFLVALLAAYLGFSPVCIHKAGAIDNSMCFNFSTFTALLAGPNNQDKTVNLVLCGDPVSQFCQLTHSILPWYGWAYFGCICVILGLSNFNSCLAANFAHSLRHSTSSSSSSRSAHYLASIQNRIINNTENDSLGVPLILDCSSRSSSRRTASPASAAYGEFGGGGFPPPKYHMTTDGFNSRLVEGFYPLPYKFNDDINVDNNGEELIDYETSNELTTLNNERSDINRGVLKSSPGSRKSFRPYTSHLNITIPPKKAAIESDV